MLNHRQGSYTTWGQTFYDFLRIFQDPPLKFQGILFREFTSIHRHKHKHSCIKTSIQLVQALDNNIYPWENNVLSKSYATKLSMDMGESTF